MNANQRDYINAICSSIKGYIAERDLQDKVGLVIFDFNDISIVCVSGGSVVFTIKVRHDEESVGIFTEDNTDRFDLNDSGIARCISLAKRYIAWEDYDRHQ